MKFYAVLGFEKTRGPIGPEPVAIAMHRTASPPLELNLVLNAPVPSTPNVLMDVPVKAPGITHIALSCPDIAAAARAIEAAGFTVKDGPIRFPDGSNAIFVRDPDGVVIELNQPSG
jgi:catechol 2,3-dioxygenase-like lactoylglutathione lyase family enzyme